MYSCFILLPSIFRKAVASRYIIPSSILFGFWQKMTQMKENQIIWTYGNVSIMYCCYNFSTNEKLQYCRFSKIHLIIRILNVFSKMMIRLKVRQPESIEPDFLFSYRVLNFWPSLSFKKLQNCTLSYNISPTSVLITHTWFNFWILFN